MVAKGLYRYSYLQKLFLCNTFRWHDISYAWTSFGQCSGFIECNRIERSQLF